MTAAGEVPLRDLLISDTLTRINTPDADADTLQTILANLEMYLDSTHSQPLPVGLLLSTYICGAFGMTELTCIFKRWALYSRESLVEPLSGPRTRLILAYCYR